MNFNFVPSSAKLEISIISSEINYAYIVVNLNICTCNVRTGATTKKTVNYKYSCIVCKECKLIMFVGVYELNSLEIELEKKFEVEG